ncbi:linear amide C-N hydrolase [Pseudomonas fluorescens]|jgi:Penicillin V acylase and related amidases|uniref:Penicillin acylase n=1 Tax=Pseudomonas fluorescens TaxID=294 RepID=A0A5E6Y1Q0_PSEFL|nr:choloylglycine hydrolase family protein [Pseudomonas fluorescens]VVN46549.1 Penicillin acylase [Pseudomonas fluorescens]VVP61037.1 Penicillin acylase [Pseudomonas fluorescens]
MNNLSERSILLKRHAPKSIGQKFVKAATVFTVIVSVFSFGVASACTSILLPTTDGSGVYARTMEFAFELKSNALVIPRQFELSSTGVDGKTGKKWKAKYAVVGLNALGVTALVDGMNEKGLAGGILYFPELAGYADGRKTDPDKALASWDVLSWILTNFATVEEVKASINNVTVIDVKQAVMGFAPPVHYTIHDATGASLVIEPIDGKFKLYDNPIGVMTNAPAFDWHMTNLRNYLKISAINASPLKVDGVTLKPLGQGSGLLGVPGDPTPPSRFVRAAAYSLTAKKQASGIDSVRLAEHIINNFDIPKGWIQTNDEANMPLEYTQWSTITDLKNRKYYIKMYDDQVLRSIDISAFDLDAKELKRAPLGRQLSPPAVIFAN